jgi:hypothetical protein
MVGKTELEYPSKDVAQFVQIKNSSGNNIDLPTAGPNGLPVDVLGTPSRVTPQTLTGTSQSVALLSTTRRVSVDVSVNAIVRLNAAASVPANGSSLTDAIAIPVGTKDFDVPASTTLHFIRDSASDGTIRISEIV